MNLKNLNIMLKVVQSEPAKFLIKFLASFGILYAFNILFIGLTTSPGYYFQWLDENVNYIDKWRMLNINATADLLRLNGYKVIVYATGIKTVGHSGFRLVYSCLGYGILSCFAAFIISAPKNCNSKVYFLILGIILFQCLNICRLYFIAIYYTPQNSFINVNHHDIFNFMIYIILIVISYLWIEFSKTNEPSATTVKKEL